MKGLKDGGPIISVSSRVKLLLPKVKKIMQEIKNKKNWMKGLSKDQIQEIKGGPLLVVIEVVKR